MFVFTCESKAKAREAFKALSLAFIINYECYQASLARGALNAGNKKKTVTAPPTTTKATSFSDGMAEAWYEE